MKSRLIVNIVLLLLVAVLGYFAFTSGDKSTELPQTLTKIKAASINKITINHNSRVTSFEKAAANWKMTAPIKIAANDFRIGTILKMLDTESHARYPANTVDLKKFGLDEPDTSITFNNHKIDFGIVNPINDYRYVKLNNFIHLIDDHYYPLISSQIGTLVARTLLAPGSKINKLILPEQKLALNTDDKWTSTADISADAIVETLNHWRNTEAFGVHNYNDREQLGVIEVHIDNQYEPIYFFITDVDPWLIIARPDIDLEYHFNLEMYDSLLRPGAVKELPDEIQQDAGPLETAPLKQL